MGVFISHIQEEAEIAFILKKWIENNFGGTWDVFVSSDIEDIPGGKKWFEEIGIALNQGEVLLTICSQKSITRPWINFEAGCAYIKEIDIIPLCHSGMNKDTLPMPYSQFQAFNFDESDFAQKLFKSLAKHKGYQKYPDINHSKFIGDLQNAISALGNHSIKKNDPIETQEKSFDSFIMSDNDIEILTLLAHNENNPLDAEQISGALEISITRVKYHLHELVSGDYIHDYLTIGNSTKYILKSKGRKFLIENNLID